MNKVNKWIRINSTWIRIKIVYWINSNKSYITLHKRHVCQLYMFINMSYHYITFRNASSNYNNYLTFKWGKFKLAKQQDSSIRPISAFVPFKMLNSCWILNDSIQVPTEWGPDLDTSIPSNDDLLAESNCW